MIVELQSTEFERVLPLYRMSGMSFPLISAVIQNKQRGQVFADERNKPNSAIIVTDFGFTFLTGAAENPLFDSSLNELFNTQTIRPSYLLWYSPPAGWQKRLDDLAADSVKRRERVRLDFPLDKAVDGQVEVPDGFELRDLTRDLIPKTERFGIKLDSRFWASGDDFVANGLGVCLMNEGEVVSLCYSAAMVDGKAEVDVATYPDFRERGFATLVTREFVKKCLSRGIVPTWDCFDYNVGSITLARRLGFVEVVRYPFYSFNTPLSLSSGSRSQ